MAFPRQLVPELMPPTSIRNSRRPGFSKPFSADPVTASTWAQALYLPQGWPSSALVDTASTLIPPAHSHTQLRVLCALLRTPGWNNGL